MQSSKVKVGDRVAINVFKNRGAEGVAKYVGPLEDKPADAIYVGIELDDPKGDMDGTYNGTELFECKPGHGLIMRGIQIKLLEGSSSNNVPALKVGGAAKRDLSDSPLLTPKDPPSTRIGVVPVKQQVSQPPEEQQKAEPKGATQAWKNRLEKLRQQKQAQKENETGEKEPNEEAKGETGQQIPNDVQEIFAPAAGIKKGKDGTLSVAKDEVKPKPDPKPLVRSAKKEPPASRNATTTNSVLEPSDDADGDKPSTKPSPSKRIGVASKIGTTTAAAKSGLRGPSQLKGPTLKSDASKIGAGESAAATKESLLKKTGEELRQKLESKKQEIKGAESSRNTLTGRQSLMKSTATKDALDKKTIGKAGDTKGDTEAGTTGSTVPKIGLKRTGSAMGTTLDGGRASARPGTARGSKVEKEEEKKIETAAQKRSTLASRTAAAKKEPVNKPIKETEDENLLADDDEVFEEVKKVTSGIGAAKHTKNSSSVSQTPTLKSSVKEVTSTADSSQVSSFQGGVSQVEFKKLETQLRKKNEEAYSLQIEVSELSSKIQTLKDEHTKKMEDIEIEYNEKIQELETRLSDNSALTNMQGDMQSKENELIQKIQELQKEKQAAQAEAGKQKKLLEEALEEKAKLLEEIELKKVDIETVQLELDILKEEKEELLEQIKSGHALAAEEANNNEDLALLSQDEIKSQNQKLRQAITTLTMNFEIEKSKMQSKMSELEERAGLVEDYEKRLEDMDILLEELELKEQAKMDMEARLEEFLDYEEMIEEMTQEILRKEEENEELVERVAELEELNALAEELGENQDDHVKELNEDLATKEAELFNLQQDMRQIEEIALDQEDQITKYKERSKELNQKCIMLQDELQNAYASGDQKVKISTLLEKQSQLISKLRDANKKDMDVTLQKIEYWQEKLKMNVVESFIPKRLHEETRLDSVEKIQLLNKTKHKAMLLIREICEKQLVSTVGTEAGGDQYTEEIEQKASLVKLFINLTDHCVKLIDACNRIHYCLFRMPIDKYSDVTTKLLAWNKFVTLSQFLEKILHLLKDEQLTPKFDFAILTASLKSIQDLQGNIEHRYIEKNSGELAEDETATTGDQKSSPERSSSPSIGQQERQREIKKCAKLNLRNESLKMAVGVMLLGGGTHKTASGSTLKQNEEIYQKCKLIYWRLFDIILKLDNIEGSNSGEDFLNIEQLSTDTRLEQKYSSIKMLWDKDDQNVTSLVDKDWSSLLEAVERDITALNNDHKFKKLIGLIDELYKDKQIEFDDLYTRGWDAKGPWTVIATKIRTDLEDTGIMRDKVESLLEKQKENAKQYLLLKREKDEILVINQSLEKRLSDSQSKAEKVSALEIEKKRLMDKESNYQQQLDNAKKELDTIKKQFNEAKAQTLELQAKVASGTAGGPGGMRESFKKTPSNAQSRQSRTSVYFTKLAQISSLSNRRESQPGGVPHHTRGGSISNTEIQKQFQLHEEAYTNIIMELQSDRMKMKSQNMTERLNKLQKSEGAFNQYIMNQREKKSIQLKLTKDEQDKLIDTLKNVDSLKSKVKKEMAQIKVIDLQERIKSTNYQKEEESMKENAQAGQEKINYMIIKAKEEVNEAMKVLFAKDSKMHQLGSMGGFTSGVRNSGLLSITKTGNNAEPNLKSGQVKIGTMMLNGAVGQNSQKKVSPTLLRLDDNMLRQLKNNLSIFAQ